MMRTFFSRLIVIAIGIAIPSFAQSPDAPAAGVQAPGPTPNRAPGGARGSRGLPIVASQMFAQGDKDGDSELNKSEFTALADVWFDKLDSDGAGKLTQEQLTSRLRTILPSGGSAAAGNDLATGPNGAPAGISFEVLGPVLFSATDLDKDGGLTRAEFKQAFAKWFDDWDAGSSGKLNQESLRKGLEVALPRPNSGARAGASVRTRITTVELNRSTPPERSDNGLAANPPPRPVEKTRELPSAASPAGDKYAPFLIIAERNIFDANRRAGTRRGSGDEPKAKKVDTITLVGAMTYEKGPYAFFDSTSPEFRKVLEPGKTIAGYQIAEIGNNNVKLTGGTNTLELRIGMQLRREDEGEWRLVEGSSSLAAPSGTSSASLDESATGAESDIIKRLMQQREQELK